MVESGETRTSGSQDRPTAPHGETPRSKARALLVGLAVLGAAAGGVLGYRYLTRAPKDVWLAELHTKLVALSTSLRSFPDPTGQGAPTALVARRIRVVIDHMSLVKWDVAADIGRCPDADFATWRDAVLAEFASAVKASGPDLARIRRLYETEPKERWKAPFSGELDGILARAVAGDQPQLSLASSGEPEFLLVPDGVWLTVTAALDQEAVTTWLNRVRARRFGQQAESQQENRAEPPVALAARYEASGDYEKAEKALSRALEDHSSEPEVAIQLSLFYYRRGRFGDSVETLERWSREHPTYPEVHLAIAAYYYRRLTDSSSTSPERRVFLEKGIHAVDCAIELRLKFADAYGQKALLLRYKATLEGGAERRSLLAEAEGLERKALDIQRARGRG